MQGEFGTVDVDRFAELGYLGPSRVLSSSQCRLFLQALADSHVRPLDWDKGWAASSRAFYEISILPAILEPVTALLGGNVLLWGASIQVRGPGEVHPWHSDIESSDPTAKTVAVWIGLEGTTAESSLLAIPRSHGFGASIQEVRHDQGSTRDLATDEDILRWSRRLDSGADLEQIAMSDGEAVFFDGKLWHGSHNLTAKWRKALLLQYATPQTAIRMPDMNRLDWPFVQLEVPRPPCLLLRGSDEAGVNRIVPPPQVASNASPPQTGSRIYPLRVPLAPDETGWKPYPVFSGSTAEMGIWCHASALASGHCPHPPHTHPGEEILIVLDGEVEVDLPSEKPTRLVSGEFVYYPLDFLHTLTTVSDKPASYLMFKWVAAPTNGHTTLPYRHFRAFDTNAETGDGFRTRTIFEGPTAQLRRLHCHASTLTPGAGYEPHSDSYDVAIVVLEGEVETLGQRVEPFGVIFYRAGEPHGIRNPSDKVARYLVFEFHGGQSTQAEAFPRRSFLVRLQRGKLVKGLRYKLSKLKKRVLDRFE